MGCRIYQFDVQRKKSPLTGHPVSSAGLSQGLKIRGPRSDVKQRFRELDLTIVPLSKLSFFPIFKVIVQSHEIYCKLFF